MVEAEFLMAGILTIVGFYFPQTSVFISNIYRNLFYTIVVFLYLCTKQDSIWTATDHG